MSKIKELEDEIALLRKIVFQHTGLLQGLTANQKEMVGIIKVKFDTQSQNKEKSE